MEGQAAQAPRRSFWQRPEGTTGKVILGGAALAAMGVFVQLLPTLLQIAQDTFKLMMYLGAFVGVYLLASAERPRTLITYAFQMLSRAITSYFVDIDPVSILKSFVRQMKKRREEVQERLNRITAVVRTLQGEIRRSEKEMAGALELAMAAKHVEDEDGLDANAEIASRRKRNIADYQEMLAQVQTVEGMLRKVLKRVDYHIRNAEDETRELVRKHQIAVETSAATKSAWAVLSDTDAAEVANEAADRIRERYENALGELQGLIEMSDFDHAVDLQQVAFRADGRAQLEALEKKLSVIESEEDGVPALAGGTPLATGGGAAAQAMPAPAPGRWTSHIRKPRK